MKQLTIQSILIVIMMSIASCSATPPHPVNTNLPAWVKEEITFAKQSPANMPVTIARYSYRNQEVYYTSPAVPDGFSQLFDANHQLICSPSGGITGQGDGQCKDFYTQAKSKQILYSTNN